MIKITVEHDVSRRNINQNLRGNRLFSGKVIDSNTLKYQVIKSSKKEKHILLEIILENILAMCSFSVGFEVGLQNVFRLNHDVEYQQLLRGCQLYKYQTQRGEFAYVRAELRNSLTFLA